MAETYLDDIILPEEIEFENDDDYLFNFDEAEARKERHRVEQVIADLKRSGLWLSD